MPIQDHGQAKNAVRKAYLDEQRKLVDTINDLASDGVIDFADLPVLSRGVRQILLGWVAKALHSNPVRTELGTLIELVYDKENPTSIVLHCDDGDFSMPKMRFYIRKGQQ